jgi:hypothetical protein
MKLNFTAIAASGAKDVWVAIGERRLAHWNGAAWQQIPIGDASSGGDRLLVAPDRKVWVVGGITLADPQVPAVVDPDHLAVARGPEIPSSARLRAIARQGEDVWVAGFDGTVLRSHAGGKFAAVAVADKRVSFEAMALDPAGKAGFLLASSQLYARSGDSFAEAAKLEGFPRGIAMAGAAAWIAGDRAWLYRDGALREVPLEGLPDHHVLAIEDERFEAVDARDANDVWMVGRAGMIAHYDGKALRPLVPRFTEHSAVGLVWTGDDTWLAAFEEGTLITGSTTSGVTGQEQAPIKDPRALARTLAGEIVIAGCHTDMFARGATGTWTKLPKLDGCVSAIAGTDVAHLWAIGSNDFVDGKAWRLDRGAWHAVATGMGKDDDARDVAVAANGDVWIAGNGAILVARKGGAFSRIARHEHDDYRGLAIRGPNDVWIATNANDIGSAGTLLHWDGKRLARFDKLTANFLSSVAVLPGGAVWAVGLGGVATYSADGKTFRPVRTDTGVTMSHVIARAPGTLVIAGEYGAIIQRDPP